MTVVAALVVVATLAAMASGRLPPVLALATGLAVAGLIGLAPPAALFAGLSNGGVITVAAMLVIAKGIVKTGVITRATWRLLATVTTATAAMRRLIVPVGVASGLMNTTPLVAMLVPASKQLQQTRGIPARQLLLPMAHATTLAGSVTLIGTSSNLLIAGIAAGAGIDMGMLSFASVALPVCLVGWVFLLVASPRLLRGAADIEAAPLGWRVEIPVADKANSIGRLPTDLGIARTLEFELVSIVRRDQPLAADARIAAGDRLVFDATEEGVMALWESPRFGLSPQHLYATSVGMGEHGTLGELEDFADLQVVAAQTDRALKDTQAVPGATCFVTTADPEILNQHESFTVWTDVVGRSPQPRKTWIALAILAGVVLAATLGLAAVELTAFAGAILMVLTGVITPRSAVRALDWNVLFILAGSVGLGAVVVESGLAAQLANAIERVSAGSTLMVVIVFAVTTTVLTNLVTNAAAASILTPVAAGIALKLDVDPVPLLALVGTCISFTFINPFGHQSNLMVMKPGGYNNRSFVKFGAPLLAVALVTACVTGLLVLNVA